MCGIFGYIGPKDSKKVCLQGLKSLEYRGYDSAGIAGLSGGNLLFRKEVGSLSVLEISCETTPFLVDLAIAHTRWATHGKASIENAHPHFDTEKTVAVVHNGIIENHFELRERLRNTGIEFYSDTDTEVIAQLIAHHYEGDFIFAIRKSLEELKGLWGIAVIHKNHPGMIIAAANESPLSIAISPETGEAFISSDSNAFMEDNLDVYFLASHEMAVITAKGCSLFNRQAESIEKIAQKLSSNRQLISKNGYPHFMLKEIFEQPHTITQSMLGRIDKEHLTAKFSELTLSPSFLKGIKRIVFLACGTSWHAGLLSALLIEELIRIPATAEIASEFRYKDPLITDDTLVIAISQSGETMDTIAAVREAKRRGAKILSICNVPVSTLCRESDSFINLNAGPEISVCSTKAFTSQITTLILFTLYLGRLKGSISDNYALELLNNLEEIPNKVSLVLKQNEEIAHFAKIYAKFPSFFFLGRNAMVATAMESALKLKEISYINATAYPAGEMKHGPIALVDENLAVIALLGNEKTLDKMLSNLMEVQARQGQILSLAPPNTPNLHEITPNILTIPQTIDSLSPILYAVACQLFAYYIALEKGTEIDKPRNLAKSVTVE